MKTRIFLLATCLLPFFFAACTKQMEPETPGTPSLPMMPDGTYKLTMNPQASAMETAEGEDTKTSISGTNIIWSTGERVKLYYGSTGTAGNAYTWETSDDEVLLSSGNQKATFYFYPAAVPTGKIGACYPASQWAADANGVNMTLPSSQTATTSTYDPLSMIMLATPVSTITTPWNCTFNRKVAVNKIALSGLGTSKVYSVKITASASNLAGTRRFDPSTGSATSTYTSGGTKTITVTYSGGATPSSGELNVFFNSWEVASGGTLTVRINFNATDGASFKEGVITLSSAIQVNKLNNFALDASKLGLRPSLVDWAKSFVGILTTWTNTKGFVDADGSHSLTAGTSTLFSTAWAGVHYVPIGTDCVNSPGYNTVPNTKDKGNQWTGTAWSMTVNGTTYNAAQAWVIAAKGLLDMMTSETSDVTNKWATGTSAWSKKITFANKNTIHKTAIPNTTVKLAKGNLSMTKFNSYPWYENTSDGGVFTGSTTSGNTPVTTTSTISAGEVLLILQFWLYRAADAYGAITNYFVVSNVDTSGYAGMSGLMCPMRMLLVMARMYKAILDNKITSNTWTNMKDRTFSVDLYGLGSNGAAKGNSIAAFCGNMGRVYTTRQNIGTTGTAISSMPKTGNALRVAVGYNRAVGNANDTLMNGTLKGACGWIFKSLFTTNDTWTLGNGSGTMASMFYSPWNSSFQRRPGTLSTPTTAVVKGFASAAPATEATAFMQNSMGINMLRYCTYYSWKYAYVDGNSNHPNYVSVTAGTYDGTSWTACRACANRIFYMYSYCFRTIFNSWLSGSWDGTNAYTKFKDTTFYGTYKN
ncbi:MAG: hypothetical protein J5871_05715 [Bacteroidales bacterium]|nr:hypothetical protein [Bacteroidales bacterium]